MPKKAITLPRRAACQVVALFAFALSVCIGQTIPANRDPRITNSINPNVTYSINPSVTYSINPKVTYSINPNVTYSINPNVTYSINPNVTYSINPNVTYSINPNVTTSLDPTKNKWSGYFIFDKKLAFVGIVVRASPDVWLLFNSNVKWVGYFVRPKKTSICPILKARGLDSFRKILMGLTTTSQSTENGSGF